MVWKRVGIAVLLTTLSLPLAAQQDSQSIIAAIKAEGMRSPEARIIFHTLTDVIGPRLTGSPAAKRRQRTAHIMAAACAAAMDTGLQPMS